MIFNSARDALIAISIVTLVYLAIGVYLLRFAQSENLLFIVLIGILIFPFGLLAVIVPGGLRSTPAGIVAVASNWICYVLLVGALLRRRRERRAARK